MSPENPSSPGHRPPRTHLHLGVAYTAKLWYVAMALACTPIYVNRLGPEGFGVVGLFLAMQRIAALFDSGFSRSINREMAQRTSGRQSVDMLRTLEFVYAGLCIGVFIAATILGEWIFGVQDSDPIVAAESIGTIVLLMASAVSAQLPSTYYLSALAGMDRHVLLNSLQIGWSTLRFLGSAVVLHFSPTLVAFFVWQLLTGVVFTVVTGAAAWIAAPGAFTRARFDRRLLWRVGGYATGGTLCAVTAVLTTQMDKLILGKQLSADEFGCYMIAWSLAASAFMVTSPVATVMFPRLARLASGKEEQSLSDAYLTGSQLVAMTVIPLAIAGAFFPEEALFGWIGDRGIAQGSATTASLLFAGVGINCLSSMPHTLQLASGWTTLSNLLNLASLVIFAPIIYYASLTWGALGAACAWLGFSLSYLVAQVLVMHRRLLKTALGSWTREQISAVGAAVLCVWAVRSVAPPPDRAASIALVLSAWLAASVGALIACGRIRRRLTLRPRSVTRREPIVAASSPPRR